MDAIDDGVALLVNDDVFRAIGSGERNFRRDKDCVDHAYTDIVKCMAKRLFNATN